MPKNSFLKAIFSGPKFSLSPIEKTNKGSVRIGEVIPVYKTMLMGRETLSLNLGHLVRFAPTVVPVMEGYEVTFDAFCVPVSALAYAQRKERDIQDFHNLALNDGSVSNPFCQTIADLRNENTLKYGKVKGYDADFFRKGSLGDYLNLPSFKNFRNFVRRWVSQSGLFEGGLFNKFQDDADHPVNAYFDVFDFAARFFLNDPTVIESSDSSLITFDASGRGYGIRSYVCNVPFPSGVGSLEIFINSDYSSLNNGVSDGKFYGTYNTNNGLGIIDVIFSRAFSFPRYLIDKYPLLASYYGWDTENHATPTNFLNHLLVMAEHNGLNLNYLDLLYEFYKIDAQSAFEEYFEYIMSFVLFNPDLIENGIALSPRLWDEGGILPDVNENTLDLTYFAAYWKIISDWYINTNIDGDPNEFFIAHAGAILDPETAGNYLDLKPFNRRWANDVFTSSVPSAMVTNINIPANGTIPDLREANAYQKLVDILHNTGKRLRDVAYGIRGYKPTAESTDMAQPLGSLHSYIGIQSVLQTSQTSKDSPLASYAGIGTDSSRGDYRKILKVVNVNEATPVVVMVLMSVTQRASYMQGLPRYFSKRSSIYDFAIPQLANIGEQAVTSRELFCDYANGADPGAYDAIFGFNRRYYDWFFEDNEVHASLRDDEDFWSGARIFSSKPSLNSEFIEINSDKDDLNRIFANLSAAARPIYYNVYFEGAKVVALPRYIQYDL